MKHSLFFVAFAAAMVWGAAAADNITLSSSHIVVTSPIVMTNVSVAVSKSCIPNADPANVAFSLKSKNETERALWKFQFDPVGQPDGDNFYNFTLSFGTYVADDAGHDANGVGNITADVKAAFGVNGSTCEALFPVTVQVNFGDVFLWPRSEFVAPTPEGIAQDVNNAPRYAVYTDADVNGEIAVAARSANVVAKAKLSYMRVYDMDGGSTHTTTVPTPQWPYWPQGLTVSDATSIHRNNQTVSSISYKMVSDEHSFRTLTILGFQPVDGLYLYSDSYIGIDNTGEKAPANGTVKPCTIELPLDNTRKSSAIVTRSKAVGKFNNKFSSKRNNKNLLNVGGGADSSSITIDVLQRTSMSLDLSCPIGTTVVGHSLATIGPILEIGTTFDGTVMKGEFSIYADLAPGQSAMVMFVVEDSTSTMITKSLEIIRNKNSTDKDLPRPMSLVLSSSDAKPVATNSVFHLFNVTATKTPDLVLDTANAYMFGVKVALSFDRDFPHREGYLDVVRKLRFSHLVTKVLESSPLEKERVISDTRVTVPGEADALPYFMTFDSGQEYTDVSFDLYDISQKVGVGVVRKYIFDMCFASSDNVWKYDEQCTTIETIIHGQDEESPNGGDGMPGYAIFLVVVAVLVCTAGIAYFGYRWKTSRKRDYSDFEVNAQYGAMD